MPALCFFAMYSRRVSDHHRTKPFVHDHKFVRRTIRYAKKLLSMRFSRVWCISVQRSQGASSSSRSAWCHRRKEPVHIMPHRNIRYCNNTTIMETRGRRRRTAGRTICVARVASYMYVIHYKETEWALRYVHWPRCKNRAINDFLCFYYCYYYYALNDYYIRFFFLIHYSLSACVYVLSEWYIYMYVYTHYSLL
jgi:hypothetical protein